MAQAFTARPKRLDPSAEATNLSTALPPRDGFEYLYEFSVSRADLRLSPIVCRSTMKTAFDYDGLAKHGQGPVSVCAEDACAKQSRTRPNNQRAVSIQPVTVSRSTICTCLRVHINLGTVSRIRNIVGLLMVCRAPNRYLSDKYSVRLCFMN